MTDHKSNPKVNYDKIHEISLALVREFLNRKGCTETMKVLDVEYPRTNKTISNRAGLAQTIYLQPLVCMIFYPSSS